MNHRQPSTYKAGLTVQAFGATSNRDDFDYAELADKGGLQKVWGVFGKELDGLMSEMNEELVA